MKYKYITIEQQGKDTYDEHPLYRILNNKSGGELGMILWYELWKQYVFTSNENCVFNKTCLENVMHFLETLI